MTPKYYLGKRSKDETGVSGTGIVFVAVDFGSDIGVVTAWRSFGDFNGGTYCYSSIEQVIAAHGHNGSTELVEFDPRHPSASDLIRVDFNNNQIYFAINDSACVSQDVGNWSKCIVIILNVSGKKDEKEEQETKKPKLYLVK